MTIMSHAENGILAELAAAAHSTAAGAATRPSAQRALRTRAVAVTDGALRRTGEVLRGIARGVRAAAERAVLDDLPPGLGARAAAAVHGVPLAREWRGLPLLLRSAAYSAVAAADDEFAAISGLQMGELQAALDQLAESGLPAVTTPAGKKWPLPAWAQMSVRTAASRLHLNLYLQAMAPQGYDLVVVYGMSGLPPCAQCAPWAGAVLSISGAAPKGTQVAAVDADGASHQAGVAGSVPDAVAAGLFHPNCRHGLAPFTDGARFLPLSGTDPRFGTAAPSDAYRHEQEIRRVERAIRLAHRLRAVAVTPQARGDAQRGLAELARHLNLLHA
jgi:hypothetical protein